MLDKIWYKLDHAEKLLMCAIYNDDLHLAAQMLHENKVNPFFGKRFFTHSPTKAFLGNSTGSIGSVFDHDDDVDLFEVSCHGRLNRRSKLEIKRRNSYYNNKESKPSVNTVGLRRTSLSSAMISQASDHFLLYVNPYTDLNARIDNVMPTYYFDQIVCDFYMHTPFYFAIKLGKLQMCQLFVESLQSVYANFASKKLTRNKFGYLSKQTWVIIVC